MRQTSKDAIYDAVNKVTGLTGSWENQKGAVKISTPHFSLKLLFPGNTYERKGNTKYDEDGKQVYITRKYTTLQVKVFGDETASDKMSSANNNTNWHKELNKGDVVSNYMIRSIDVSSVYDVEWENVYLFDFYITFDDESQIQPDSPTDDVIEREHIEADIDGNETDIYIPEEAEIYK